MRRSDQQNGYSSRSNSTAWHVCSYCNKVYSTLQALGGHQTAHRKEIEEMRRQYRKKQHRGNKKAAMAVEESSVNLELTLGNGDSGLDLSLRL
ncbi:hypothetical protein IEQ34_013735 [Dendrobium chrysotoxum]|uniref:C2H2-type domain-containing protein n=1 Tax=Dendrobium chrysotoxum TaxID=161865 RepID=A0AAV7GT43_DENCH|nr:hypothetical protein IEQ34_013735 [Dendrobium chrysotoxum]